MLYYYKVDYMFKKINVVKNRIKLVDIQKLFLKKSNFYFYRHNIINARPQMNQ